SPQPARMSGQNATRFCSACGSAAAAKAWRKERRRQVIQQQLKTKNGNQVPMNQIGATRPCSSPQSKPASKALDGMLQRPGISASIPPSSRVSTTGANRTPPMKARHPVPASTWSIPSLGRPASSSTASPSATQARAPARETRKARNDRHNRRPSGSASNASRKNLPTFAITTSLSCRHRSAARKLELEPCQVGGRGDLEVVLAAFHQQRALALQFERHGLVGDLHPCGRGGLQCA